MGYLHISNLYKETDLLMFRELYALEKVHGTSAHIAIKDGQLRFFSGGASHVAFTTLFDSTALTAKFTQIGQPAVVVYGEAYGGKMQGMKNTYGPDLRFIAFDVKIGTSWLSVPQAEEIVKSLGLQFVPYVKVSATVEDLNRERDAPSAVAKLCGITEDRPREGVVLRPLIELTKNNGERLIAKHKRDEFKETRTSREIDPERIQTLSAAQDIATEWVTEMRLSHVLDKLPEAKGMEQTSLVIKAMFEDVKREAGEEIIWSKEAQAAVGRATAQMFKKRLSLQPVAEEPQADTANGPVL